MRTAYQRHRRERPKKSPQRERRLPGGFRSLHFPNDVTWHYRIRGGGVTLLAPSGEKIHVNMVVFTGWSWYSLERADWKGYWPEIGPGDIKRYIENHDILGNECPGGPPIVRDADRISMIHSPRAEDLICPSCGERVADPGWFSHPGFRHKPLTGDRGWRSPGS